MLVYALNRPRRPSRIVAHDLDGGPGKTIRGRPGEQLLNPSLSNGRLLYERVDDCRQRLLLARLAAPRRARVLARASTQVRRDGGYGPNVIHIGRTPHHCVGPLAGSYPGVTSYWTTALSPSAAYMTLMFAAGGRVQTSVLQFPT